MPVSASILHPCSLGSQGQGLLSPRTVLGDGQYNTAAHRVFHGHLGRDALAAPTLQTGTWAVRALGSCPSSCGLWHRVRGEVSTAHSAPWARPWSSGPAALEERGHIYPFHLRPLCGSFLRCRYLPISPHPGPHPGPAATTPSTHPSGRSVPSYPHAVHGLARQFVNEPIPCCFLLPPSGTPGF